MRRSLAYSICPCNTADSARRSAIDRFPAFPS